MKQEFDIEKAKNGAKVITRDGDPVRIICYDGNGWQPIVGYVGDKDVIVTWFTNGRNSQLFETNLDLFIETDEESKEELTPFEKKCEKYFFGNAIEPDSEGMYHLHRIANDLLAEAKKQLEKEFIERTQQAYRDGYGDGEEHAKETMEKRLTNVANADKVLDICKDTAKTWEQGFGLLVAADRAFKRGRKEVLDEMPKWKDVSQADGSGTRDYEVVGYYLVKGNYGIALSELEKLPKVENPLYKKQ